MAKKSIRNRDLKRRVIATRYSAKVAELKKVINDFSADDEAKAKARLALEKLPKDAHVVRQRNRCILTGRPRGVYRRFGLGRNKLRDLALKGDIPGITKASW